MAVVEPRMAGPDSAWVRCLGPRAAGLAGTPLEGAAHGAFVQYAGPCQAGRARF
jgi:hypothetical protein